MPQFEPVCSIGYTRDEVIYLIGESNLDKFDRWFNGQTAAICEGRTYNYDTDEYEETGCGPHGLIFYRHDVTRFIYNNSLVGV